MARVYADVNQNMPRAYWDYDSVNISEPRPPARLCQLPTSLARHPAAVSPHGELVMAQRAVASPSQDGCDSC